MTQPSPSSLPSDIIADILAHWRRVSGTRPVQGYVRFLEAHLCIALAIESGKSQAMVDASAYVVERLRQMDAAYRNGQYWLLPVHWQTAFIALKLNRFRDDVIYMLFGFAHLTVDLQDALKDSDIPEAEFFADASSFMDCSRSHMPSDTQLLQNLNNVMAPLSVGALRTFYFYRARGIMPQGIQSRFFYLLGSATPIAITSVIKQIVQNKGLAATFGLLK